MNPNIPIQMLCPFPSEWDEVQEALFEAERDGVDVLAANSLMPDTTITNIRRVSDDFFQQMSAATPLYKSVLLFVRVERGMDADEALRIMQDRAATELEKPMQIVTIQLPSP